MRSFLITLFCLSLSAVSCKKDSEFLIPKGNYTGTFQRQTATGGTISNVTLTFSSNGWSGQSQISKYPALCHGTYEAKATDSISFNNVCAWTADFDWTFILSGDYKLVVSGKNVEISRSYNGEIRDIYQLTKQ